LPKRKNAVSQGTEICSKNILSPAWRRLKNESVETTNKMGLPNSLWRGNPKLAKNQFSPRKQRQDDKQEAPQPGI